ncbi:WGR domain-containing protein (plasmid) [Clostridium perfringens]
MEQKLILIDLMNQRALFYNIKIEKSKDNYMLVATSGKIGNKGVTAILYKGEDYTLCKNEFWKKIYEKKSNNYRLLKDSINKINAIFGFSEYFCDMCGESIEASLYKKIDNYLRNETSVDSDRKDIKDKVLCFKCQKKEGIYKGKTG